MRVRLFRPSTGEEICVAQLSERNGVYLGKVEVLSCRGPTLALFHELERLVNDNVIGEAERVSEELDCLEFLVEGLPGFANPRPCRHLQLMNGIDISFRI